MIIKIHTVLWECEKLTRGEKKPTISLKLKPVEHNEHKVGTVLAGNENCEKGFTTKYF